SDSPGRRNNRPTWSLDLTPLSGDSTLKSSHLLVFILPIFFAYFGHTRGSDARVSFPETLRLPKRRRFGSDAHFSCERPDRVRVPKSKHRHSQVRIPNSEPRHNQLRVPRSKHRLPEGRDPVRVTRSA